MTASALSLLLATTPCIVHFVKKDGTPRRMFTTPGESGVVVRQGYVTVLDAEKGEYRRVNPATVTSVVQLRATAKDRAPAPRMVPARPSSKPEHVKTTEEHAADIFG